MNEDSNEIITGVENIIQYIISKCENDCQSPEPMINKQISNKNYDLREYLMEQAMDLDNSPEEALDLNKVKSYEDRYAKKRDNIQAKTVNTNKNIMNNLKKNNIGFESGGNAEAGDFIKNSNEETITNKRISAHLDDDDETKNYWENQEETFI